MAIKTNYDKQGKIRNYKFTICTGRDARNKQLWATKTVERPEGLTPAKERKEIERQHDEWANMVKGEARSNSVAVDRGKITYADFVNNHWLPDRVNTRKHTPTTIEFYKTTVQYSLAYFGDKKKLISINSEDVNKFIAYLGKEEKTRSGKPISDGTIQHAFNTLRNVLEYAKRIQYIKEDPCQLLTQFDKPSKAAAKVDFLSVDEVKKLLTCLNAETIIMGEAINECISAGTVEQQIMKAESDNERWNVYHNLFWYCFVRLLLKSGLRRGEALGLQWADLNDGSIWVRRNVSVDNQSEDKYSIGKTKNKKERVVYIPDEMCTELSWLRLARGRLLGDNIEVSEHAFIFSKREDPFKPINPNVPTRWLARFNEKNGLRSASPHDLRHTYSTLSQEAGIPTKVVQEQLGHNSEKVTLGNYTGVSKDQQIRNAQTIQSIMK